MVVAQADLDAAKAAANQTVHVLPPDEKSVTLVYEPDQRIWYVIIAMCILGMIFGGPIWMSLREPQSEIPPLASLASKHSKSAHESREGFETVAAREDEAHAATA
jgi:hypothetical protein